MKYVGNWKAEKNGTINIGIDGVYLERGENGLVSVNGTIGENDISYIYENCASSMTFDELYSVVKLNNNADKAYKQARKVLNEKAKAGIISWAEFAQLTRKAKEEIYA